MRMPGTYYADNLMFTRNGVIWATWRLKPLWHKFAPAEKQTLVRLQHQALWQSFRGEAMLLGLCADIEPAAVVAQMIDGVDLRANELWLENAEQALASLEQIGVGERTFWLAVPLTSSGLSSTADVGHSVMTTVREAIRLPGPVPSQAKIVKAKEQATRIAQQIPGAFAPVPATPAQQLWISLHAQLRGLHLEGSPPPELHDDDHDWQSAGRIEPLLDEGGQADATAKERLTPYRRRYLKVVSPLSDTPTYQSLLALASTPKRGWQASGGEWMARIDEFEFDVDWCQRVRVGGAKAAKTRNKSVEKKLEDQVFQQSESTESITGPSANLEQVAKDLAAYQEALGASEREVEIRATTILAVSGSSPDEVRVKRDAIREDGASIEFVWDPVLGGQETFWWAMQPGVALPQLVEEYEQLTTGAKFATALPLTASPVGNNRGALAGFNRSSGRTTPFLFDPAEDIEADRSGAFGITGDLGSGKSVWLKIAIFGVLARGGRVLSVDPTPLREYAPVLEMLSDDAVAVDPLDPTCSLDPLRILPLDQAARVVQTLFATLLGVGPIEDRGALLAELIDPAYLGRHGIGSLGGLRDHLAASDDPELRALLRIVNLVATKDIGRVLFDDTLPPVSMSSRAITVSTADLQLPTQGELDSPTRFTKMTVEKVFGNAIYGLIASMAEQICFSDRHQLALFAVDEASKMSAPQAQAILETFVTNGRKHAAPLGLAGQNVDHLGPPSLRGLIPTRFAFRQRDPHLAARAAEWMGLDEGGSELIQNLSPNGVDGRVIPGREGEAMLRDAQGRVAKIRTQMPFVDVLEKAFNTTPELRGSGT